MIYVNVLTFGFASFDAGCYQRLQAALRKMEEHGHHILGVSIVAEDISSTGDAAVMKEYECYVVSRYEGTDALVAGAVGDPQTTWAEPHD
jgi:hypothetical protein